jgi:ATP-dependent Zn protease
MTAWESTDQQGPFGRTNNSEEKEDAIDAAVSQICDAAFDVTKKTLSDNRALLDEVVKRLMEKETLDGFELKDIVQEITGKPAPVYANISDSAQEALQAKLKMEGTSTN